MAREQHDYDDIPGTFVFDAERSRQGFGINMFCMSLMKDENRKAFKADEAEYVKRFKLTPEQTEAVLKRDYNRMLNSAAISTSPPSSVPPTGIRSSIWRPS